MPRFALSLLAAAFALSPAQAQTSAPSDETPAVFAHPAQGAKIIVFRASGAYAPDAVWLESPAGAFMISDMELYSLGRDIANWDILTRENIYTMRVEGLNYSATSSVSAPAVRRWDDAKTVANLQEIVKYLPNKYEAPVECGKRAADLLRAASRAEGSRLSLDTAEKMEPGSVQDVAELAKLKDTIASAKAAATSGKALCVNAAPTGYRAAYLALNAAQGALAQAANVLAWLPVQGRQ